MTHDEKWKRIEEITAAIQNNRKQFDELCAEKDRLLMTGVTDATHARVILPPDHPCRDVKNARGQY